MMSVDYHDPYASPCLQIMSVFSTIRGHNQQTPDGGGCHTGGCSPVAVVVLVLLAVEAAVLEGLVPFLVPVTNSICGPKTNFTKVTQLLELVKVQFRCNLFFYFIESFY